MAELKTQPTDVPVDQYLSTVEPGVRREDGFILKEMFDRITGWQPVMWGPTIVGYGHYDYTTDAGHSGRWPITGFSPRKANLSIYIMLGVKRYPELLEKLGPHKHGVSCLYITRLARIDQNILEQLVRADLDAMIEKYGQPS